MGTYCDIDVKTVSHHFAVCHLDVSGFSIDREVVHAINLIDSIQDSLFDHQSGSTSPLLSRLEHQPDSLIRGQLIKIFNYESCSPY